MTDLRRLIDQPGVTGEERALLVAGASDRPGDDSARDRALVLALGAAAPLGSGAAATGAAKLGAYVWKGFAIVLLGGAMSAGVLHSGVIASVMARTRAADVTRVSAGIATTTPTRAIQAPPVRLEPGPTADAPGPTADAPRVAMAPVPTASHPRGVTTVAAGPPPAAMVVSPPAPALVPTEPPVSRGVAGAAEAQDRGVAPIGDPPTPAATSRLTLEIASLDEVRSALARGDAVRALGALGAYARAFPRGALRPEADVLRIQALLASGDRAAAKARADALTRSEPDGPYARRVRKLLPP